MDGRISLVIITKDTKDMLAALLASIEADTSLTRRIAETIVVDNGSQDGTIDMISERFSTVRCVSNGVNLGFARAVNKGAALAGSEYILFLNSDTIIIKGEMEKVVAFMDGNGDVAICGPQLVYPDMRRQRSYAAVPSLASFGKGRVRESKIVDRKPLNSDSPQGIEVESLIGAAILVRKNDLVTLGGFDERFFFFLEETDLCLRARQGGKKVIFFPGTRIIHLQGKTVGKRWVSGRLEYNISLYKFIRKHHNIVYFSIFSALRFIKAFIYVLMVPLPLFGKRLRMRYTYYLRLLLWHIKGCPDNMGLRS